MPDSAVDANVLLREILSHEQGYFLAPGESQNDFTKTVSRFDRHTLTPEMLEISGANDTPLFSFSRPMEDHAAAMMGCWVDRYPLQTSFLYALKQYRYAGATRQIVLFVTVQIQRDESKRIIDRKIDVYSVNDETRKSILSAK